MDRKNVLSKNIFEKLKIFLINNSTVIILILFLIAIIIFTIYYSEIIRPKNKLKSISNGIVYKEDRLQLDFCGIDNSIKDTIRTSITVNTHENSILFLNKNINIYEIGLSSEYYIDIKKSLHNDNGNTYYKILKVGGVNKLFLDRSGDSLKLNKNEINTHNVIITYFRPSKNHNIYKYKSLTDYFICSSYNSFLIGNQKADYCDINMIERVLHFGARYIELEVMDKELKNVTEPIVCTGIEEGNLRTSLNYLKFDDCIKLIANTAFSEQAIINFNDPLFLFLNLKTKNINTFDQIYKILIDNLSRYLLAKKYNHINPKNLKLCELKRKVVLLTNKVCPNSELDKLITCSSDKPYLKRITMKELDTFKDKNNIKLEFNSNKISFKGSLDSNIISEDTGIDFIKSGIKAGDLIQINNANNPKNNSGLTLYKIKDVTQNLIVFEENNLFNNEKSGANISLKFFDEDYSNMEKGIEEYNKNNITIIIPDNNSNIILIIFFYTLFHIRIIFIKILLLLFLIIKF